MKAQKLTLSVRCRMGTIVVELYWDHAPKTCKNFAELARRGYYNSTKFHRIIKDFMVQGGDPTATGGHIIYLVIYSIAFITFNQKIGIQLLIFVHWSCFRILERA